MANHVANGSWLSGVGLIPTAFLKFPSGAARTGIISFRGLPQCFSPHLPLLGRDHLHYIAGRPATAEEASHRLHVWIDVMEEPLIARTQVIEACLAVGSMDKPVLGTFSIACKTHITLEAVFG